MAAYTFFQFLAQNENPSDQDRIFSTIRTETE